MSAVGDARKRLERQARTASPISVRRDDLGDWSAECDESCAAPLSLCATFWSDAYEAALGHACLRHKGRP